ncbi:MAG: MgtC/SapB family protein [Lachnospiraceae bacterium]|nr:MgtC/SapB family protein [Lachnospiraceae bacterium]
MNWNTFYKMLSDFNDMSVVIRIFLAMFFGGFIGIEREKSKRPAGFRTHILVCVGACLTSLLGLFLWNQVGDITDPARISAQVISGIGFLGVGTILVKEHDHITGLTTAAGLWTTAAIGIACGYGFYSAALVGTLVVTVTSAVLFKLESGTRKKNCLRSIYLEITDVEQVNEYTDWFWEELNSKNVLIVAPRSAMKHHIGIEIVLSVTDVEETKKILERIRAKEKVAFAIESIRKNTQRN